MARYQDIDLDPVGLISEGGARFSLIPGPELHRSTSDGTPHLVVDIELLSPDRLVRYLSRVLSRSAVEQLTSMFMSCAEDAHPELTVATVSDGGSGLMVAVVGSDPLTVTMQVSVIAELDAAVLDHDAVAFDISRAALISGSHQLDDWILELEQMKAAS